MKRQPLLANYGTAGRAEVRARQLRVRWPDTTFTVKLSPLAAYPFRYLIFAIRRSGGGYVSKAR
jgi:hypothetical protein